MDDAGQPLAPGKVGRLAVKGPTGCRYLADERQKSYVKDGWNYTGDAYLVDDEGYFVFQARTDDMIISAGCKIAGPEVESALLMHPAVAECAVIGVTDKREYAGAYASTGAVYRDIMGRHYPAMTAIEVAALIEDAAKVEIEATAVIPG